MRKHSETTAQGEEAGWGGSEFTKIVESGCLLG